MTQTQSNTSDTTKNTVQTAVARSREAVDSTLDKIEDRLNASALMDEAASHIEYYADSAADAGREAAEFARRNPAPVILTGVGLAWLAVALSRKNSEDDTYEIQPAGVPPKYLDRFPEDGEDDADESRVAKLKAGAAERVDTLKIKAGETTEAFKARVAATRAKSEKKWADTKTAAGEKWDATKSKAQQVNHDARVKASVARQRVGNEYDNQPLLFGLAGLAIGAVLGTVIPQTRRENEVLGPRRDRVIDRAQQLGEETTNRIENAADAALATADEEARKQGLTNDQTKETLSDAAGDLASKVKTVADSAKTAAIEEFKSNPSTPKAKAKSASTTSAATPSTSATNKATTNV